jgi:hypothetical protein
MFGSRRILLPHQISRNKCFGCQKKNQSSK